MNRTVAPAAGSDLSAWWLYDTNLWAGSPNDLEEQIGAWGVGVADMTDLSGADNFASWSDANPTAPDRNWQQLTGITESDLVWTFVAAWSNNNWGLLRFSPFMGEDPDEPNIPGGDYRIEVRCDFDGYAYASAGGYYQVYVDVPEGTSFFSGDWSYPGALPASGVAIIEINVPNLSHSMWVNGSLQTPGSETLPTATSQAAMAGPTINELTVQGYSVDISARSNVGAAVASGPWDLAGWVACSGEVSDINAETDYWADYFGVTLP